MRYLLNLLYVVALVLLSPVLAYIAWRKGKYREGFAAKFLGSVPRRTSQGPCIWLHAVSVGEVNVLATLVTALRTSRPDCEIVISTTTKTGYDLARKKYVGLSVFYCPLDFSWAVDRALRRIRPDLLVLAELELWPNLIAGAHRRGTKVAVINARLSEKSYRGYRRFRPVLRWIFASLDLVAAQDDTYASRFIVLGTPDWVVRVTGSLKFDGAETDRQNPRTQQLRTLACFAPDDVVLLGGSTQNPEEELLLQTYQQLSAQFPKLRLVLVPRHPDRFSEVADMLAAARISFCRRSELDLSNSAGLPRVLLVDAVGELGAWWGTAHIAYVGGSLGQRGGQNMIEPAAYGAAVSFGPNTWNFREIVAALLAADGAVVVNNQSELAAFVGRCLSEPHWAAELGASAQRLVQRQLGATTRTIERIERLLPPLAGKPGRAAA